jgi:hypothetical protein
MDPDGDADPDPAIFVIDLQEANKKQIFYKFSVHHFLKVPVHLHNISMIKSPKEVTKGFSYYKNMWIRWIRILIRNTGST